MTRSQIIKIVQDRTENKLVSNIDYNDLLADVEQAFCAEHRFWFLHKRLSFQTVAGTPTYDLTQITTVPAGAGLFVDEITRVVLIDGTGNVCKLTGIFDDESVAAMVADQTTAQPGSYTLDQNDMANPQVLRLGKIPNGVYTIHVYFWGMPNPTPDSDDDAIYLVPPTKHHILKLGLEKEVWRLVYGEQDPKYATALAAYQRQVLIAKKKPAFSTEKEQYFSSQSGEAIRSTR
jgi:hypothetical protein